MAASKQHQWPCRAHMVLQPVTYPDLLQRLGLPGCFPARQFCLPCPRRHSSRPTGTVNLLPATIAFACTFFLLKPLNPSNTSLHPADALVVLRHLSLPEHSHHPHPTPVAAGDQQQWRSQHPRPSAPAPAPSWPRRAAGPPQCACPSWCAPRLASRPQRWCVTELGGRSGQGAIFRRVPATFARGYLPWLFQLDLSAACVQSAAGHHQQAQGAAGTPVLSRAAAAEQ